LCFKEGHKEAEYTLYRAVLRNPGAVPDLFRFLQVALKIGDELFLLIAHFFCNLLSTQLALKICDDFFAHRSFFATCCHRNLLFFTIFYIATITSLADKIKVSSVCSPAASCSPHWSLLNPQGPCGPVRRQVVL